MSIFFLNFFLHDQGCATVTLFRKPASQHVIVMQEFTPVLWSAPFDFTTSGLLQFPVFLPKYLLSSSFYRSTMAAKEGDPPDFSEAWLFSDVVFVVEDKKFHVHRIISHFMFARLSWLLHKFAINPHTYPQTLICKIGKH